MNKKSAAQQVELSNVCASMCVFVRLLYLFILENPNILTCKSVKFQLINQRFRTTQSHWSHRSKVSFSEASCSCCQGSAASTTTARRRSCQTPTFTLEVEMLLQLFFFFPAAPEVSTRAAVSGFHSNGWKISQDASQKVKAALACSLARLHSLTQTQTQRLNPHTDTDAFAPRLVCRSSV